MLISEVTLADVKGYCNVYHDMDDTLLTGILAGAKAFIVSYTGIPLSSEDPEEITVDAHEDLTIALLILCAEMYDNRAVHVEFPKIGFVIRQLLDSHSTNLL